MKFSYKKKKAAAMPHKLVTHYPLVLLVNKYSVFY